MEVLIVMALIGMVATMGIPRLFKKENSLRVVARHLPALSKMVRNRARLSNSTMRIVFKLDPKDPSYWVEKANGVQQIDLEALNDYKIRNGLVEKKIDEESPPPPPFQPDKAILKKPKTIPSGFFIQSVETNNTKEPITEGLAFIYYSPEGLTERAIVQIGDKKKFTWSFVVNPLTGQIDVIDEAKSIKDLSQN